jgi:glycosyltransferase involved in cell wall biosynthesis
MSVPYDLICLSHLRWDFVYQRPQHLLSRFAREHRVFFVEEPMLDAEMPYLACSLRECGAWVVVPHLPSGLSVAETHAAQQRLLDRFFSEHGIDSFVLWYYTPMAMPFTRHLKPLAIVYDCMDELSEFRGAPPDMRLNERELLAQADLLFAGGRSLYEVKRQRHPNAHLFPSSVDVTHFSRARRSVVDPVDQRDIPRPRIGFFGVIDERMDLELLAGLTAARSEWQFIMIGPVVKIDPASLPRRSNIHYLGPKRYDQLPDYLAGWDVAMLPFARNHSTRFISPTKTPEYLAAGKPVVSTSITDVVHPYGEQGLALIADEPHDFARAIEHLLLDDGGERQQRADAFLGQTSWERTWAAMAAHVDQAMRLRRQLHPERHHPRAIPLEQQNIAAGE